MAFKNKFKFLITLILMPAVYLLAHILPQSQIFINKNTILDNFISEKMLAFVKEQNNPLSLKPLFQSTLKTIKAKLTQDRLYSGVGFNTIQLDSAELKNSCILSVRETEFEFCPFHIKKFVHTIKPLSPVMIANWLHNI